MALNPCLGGLDILNGRNAKEFIWECAKNRIRSLMHTGDVDVDDVTFEMIVLDTALGVTVSKFHRNLTRMKPIFNNLLAVILRNPSDKTLEKLHAFKKSLLAFEIRCRYYKLVVIRLNGATSSG